MAERVVVRGHAIDRGDRPHGAGIVVGATVAHDAHGADGQQRHEGLPDLVVEAVLADLVDEDRIRLAQDVELLRRDLARAADREAGSRERVAADEALRQAEFTTERADLVLEELAQRLHQLQAHLLGQTADIVVRLDRDRRAAREADALDHVRIQGALREEGRALDLVGVLLEHVDEEPADGLALDLGVRHSGQLAEEQVALVGVDQRDVVVVAEHGDDLVRLALAQEAVVHEDAGQIVADRLVDQHRRDRAVDSTRKPADHLGVANLVADLLDRLLAVGAHGPVAGKAGVLDEVLVERPAVRGVVHLGVELHRVEAPLKVRRHRVGRAGRGPVDRKARRQLGDVVAVAHPDLLAPAAVHEPASEKVDALLGRHDPGAAELGGAVAALHLSAEHLRHHLLAVADAENRHAQFEHLLRRARAVGVDHRGRAARQDHRFRRHFVEKRVVDLLEWMDFAVDVQFAQPTRDQLRHLGAEVDDEKAVVGGLVHGPCQ
ncbi:cytosine deaminase [Roseivivax marinus]|uniref:Cytosine deaminase n=1 Tax=Roseivivax marinus TaxID=1379903 RepID=W4HRP1_9RHOB|nr:cytosine deaminase [Roseivivax marinus]